MMPAQYDEQIKVSMAYCTPPPGQFGIPGASGLTVASWDHCREQFAAKFGRDIPEFFVSHLEGRGICISEFICHFEEVLTSDIGKNKFFHSRFSPTTNPSVTLIKPSQFWRECFFRRSLFTLLVRSGQNYCPDIKNFDDCLFGNYKECQFIRETKKAVVRFMFGFTVFQGNHPPASGSTVIKHGWREEFDKSDEPTIRKKLAIPDYAQRSYNIVGLDALWA
jgi:hypothetical protein